jgi:hypothetical protein
VLIAGATPFAKLSLGEMDAAPGRNHGGEKCSAICFCAIHDIERRATDAAACRWSARQPAAIFDERKDNMLAHRKRTIALVLLLIFSVSWLNASGKKMWTVSVAKLGYHGDAWRTIVRWRGNYIVIGSVKFIPDPEKNQCIVSSETAFAGVRCYGPQAGPRGSPGQPGTGVGAAAHAQALAVLS